MQRHPIGQQPLEPGAVQRTDAQHETRLRIPGAYPDRRVECQPVELAVHPDPRPLVHRQPQPGAGKFLHLDLHAQPVGQHGAQPIRRARPHREQPGVMQDRVGPGQQPRRQVRRAKPGQRQQGLGHRVSRVGRPQRRRLRRARRPVLHRRTREERHEAMAEHVEELMQGRRATAPRLRDDLGIGAR